MAEATLLNPTQIDNLFGDVESEELRCKAKAYLEMYQELESSIGQQYRDLLNDVSRSKTMLDENYAELISSINHFENNPDSWLMDDENRTLNALMDFARKLHNYLAMCLSLRDHTFRAKNKLERDDLDDRYTQEMQNRDLVNLASFIINLRHYMQHRRIPIVTGKTNTHVVSGGPTEKTSKILFDKDELLDWKGWDDNSNEILEALEEEFQIRSILEDYHSTLTDFYHWFFDYVTELYSDEIAERDDLIIEMARLQEELLPGINEDFLENKI